MQTQLFERWQGTDYRAAMPTPEGFVFNPTNPPYGVENKPTGCLWTSPYTGEQTGSAWIQWCLSGQFGAWGRGNPFDCYLITVSKWANILPIASYADLLAVWKRYPLKVPSLTLDSPIPERARQRLLDFEQLAMRYDAIQLTEKGSKECRASQTGLQLWSWYTESVCWFRRIWTVEHIGMRTFEIPGEKPQTAKT